MNDLDHSIVTNQVPREAEVAEDAARYFAEHVVTVEHEDGLYRHYRCANPKTINLSFHVVTFPGRLIICGDIGGMAWERCPDMLEWAAGAVHSTDYFAEKVWKSIKVKEFDEEMAKSAVQREYEDRLKDAESDYERQLLTENRDFLLSAIEDGESFYSAYSQSDWYGGEFPSVENFTREFLRCREAVKWFLAWHKARASEEKS